MVTTKLACPSGSAVTKTSRVVCKPNKQQNPTVNPNQVASLRGSSSRKNSQATSNNMPSSRVANTSRDGPKRSETSLTANAWPGRNSVVPDNTPSAIWAQDIRPDWSRKSTVFT